MIIVLTSVDDKSKANFIAQSLVQQKLAACVQISAQGTSVYQWQDKICTENEYYISIKTNKIHQDKVITWLETNHPYDIPEIITLNAKASTQYEHWLQNSLA
ncbi:divalent-cation tolerance protein CutA [Ghiorsea bivora]|uniref:divalent-cation tolerance protein CutA n=1 Tax=Ghiorsea bivora TaxID=1485545 RepID=UPI00056EC619|nr:divalent-cation tolerance protein CutA [Ghiorsea bivora]